MSFQILLCHHLTLILPYLLVPQGALILPSLMIISQIIIITVIMLKTSSHYILGCMFPKEEITVVLSTYTLKITMVYF